MLKLVPSVKFCLTTFIFQSLVYCIPIYIYILCKLVCDVILRNPATFWAGFSYLLILFVVKTSAGFLQQLFIEWISLFVQHISVKSLQH